jgi:hypothetical protein
MLTNPIWVVKTRVFATGKNDPAAFRGLWGMSSITLTGVWLTIQTVCGRYIEQKGLEDYTRDPY